MDCGVVEAVRAERLCVRGSHSRRGERQLPRVVAERSRVRVEVGLAVVVLRVPCQLVWCALVTEVVCV